MSNFYNKMNLLHKFSREKQGELIIFIESILWGAYPVIALLAYQFLSPIRVLAWSYLISTLFFGILSLLQKQKNWQELKNRKAWKTILIVVFFNLICFHTILFLSLKLTTAGNVALISSMEIWFSFLFFGLILRKEKYTLFALLGAAVMFIGVLFVLFPGTLQFNKGDLLILLATMLPPIGNYFQQKARKLVSSTILLIFMRNILALPFLFLLANIFEGDTKGNLLKALPFLLINGLLIFGISKALWIEGIHRISVTKAVSINAFTPVITLLYAFLLLNEIPNWYQIIGLPLIIIGGLLITKNNFLRKSHSIN
jgi:drug/metabolite transporter (DMT)-like permease